MFLPGYFWEDVLMGKLHESSALLCHHFGKVIPRSVCTAQQSPALGCQSSASGGQLCIGMSQPGEVRALDSSRAMDLLEDDKSSSV